MKLKKIQLLLLILLGSCALFAQNKNTKVEHQREVKYYLIEAKSALSQGNVQKAIGLYNKCIGIDKTCATAHYELANVALAVKDIDVAMEHSRAAVQIAPENAWYNLQLAEIYEGRGMLKQAAEAYKNLAKIEQQNPIYLQKSIALYQTVEEWDEALKVFDIYEKQHGTDFNLLAGKQSLYAKAGRENDGFKELQRLVKKEPKNAEFLSLLAMYYQTHEEDKKAKKTIEKIAKLEAKNGVSEMILAQYYVKKGDYAKTFTSLKNAIKSGEVNEQASVAMVIELLQADTTKQAKQYRNELSSVLIQQFPDNAVGYLFKSQEYNDLEDYDQQSEVLKKALEIDPTNYNGLAQLCIMQNIQKQWDNLYETAKKGVEYYPQEHLFYIFKGLAASQKNEYVVAESSLGTAYLYATEDEAKDDIRELLADVYYKSGQVQKSFDLFEEILVKDADNKMVLNNYAYFLSLEEQDLDKAEKMSRKTVDAEPENATYLDTYAWVLFQQKKYIEALEYMEKAIEYLGEDEASSEMWEHYGDMLFQQGKVKQAVVEWKKALSLPEPETERLQKKIADNE